MIYDWKEISEVSFLKSRLMHQAPASPTTVKIMRLITLAWPPKSAPTASKPKIPISPQLSAPIMATINAVLSIIEIVPFFNYCKAGIKNMPSSLKGDEKCFGSGAADSIWVNTCFFAFRTFFIPFKFSIILLMYLYVSDRSDFLIYKLFKKMAYQRHKIIL